MLPGVGDNSAFKNVFTRLNITTLWNSVFGNNTTEQPGLLKTMFSFNERPSLSPFEGNLCSPRLQNKYKILSEKKVRVEEWVNQTHDLLLIKIIMLIVTFDYPKLHKKYYYLKPHHDLLLKYFKQMV